ncbi:MAG: response regulator transcription factor [Puniceicoccaceae bacterium]
MNSNPCISILLVDDHIVMRMGLVSAISGEPDLKVIAESENGMEAIEAYQTHRPDVVILDLRMPQLGGLQTIRKLNELNKHCRILVYSNFAGGEEIYSAFRAGASGFVAKDMPLDQLLEAIRIVHRGETFMPPEVSARIGFRAATNLTPREMEVLACVAKGMSNKEIGAELNLVEGTVKVHLTSILSKLGVADRTQAVLLAVKRGIIEIE